MKIVVQQCLRWCRTRPVFSFAVLCLLVLLRLFASAWIGALIPKLGSNVPRGEKVVRSGLWDELSAIPEKYPSAPVSGGIFLYKKQTRMLAHLIDEMASRKTREGNSSRFRVCETGFAAGHSAALWLASSDSVDVVVFDKFDRAYQMECLELLRQRFPGRIHHVAGDNCQTVPRYAESSNPACDFVHASSLCAHDVANLCKLSSCGALVTASAMENIGTSLYFGEHGQGEFSQGCVRGELTGVRCYKDEAFVLEKDLVFGAQGLSAAHEFCLAAAMASCESSPARPEAPHLLQSVHAAASATPLLPIPPSDLAPKLSHAVRASGCLAQ